MAWVTADRMADELLEQQHEAKTAKPAPDPRFTGYRGHVLRETHGGSPKQLLVGGPIKLPITLPDGTQADAAQLKLRWLRPAMQRLGVPGMTPEMGADALRQVYRAHLEAEAAKHDPKAGRPFHESMKLARASNG